MITYDVEVGDAIEKRQLPFVIGVLADLSGQPDTPLPRLKERRFVEATPDNIDSIMQRLAPRLAFAVENKLGGPDEKIRVELRFRSLEDFGPEAVVAQVPILSELLQLRGNLYNLRSALQGNERLETLLQDVLLNLDPANALDGSAAVIDRIVDGGHLGRLQEEKEQGRQWIQVFLSELGAGRMAVSRDTEAMLTGRIGEIDDQLSIQLNEILHGEPFQRLEASWRGLHYLVSRTETGPMLKIRVLNISKKDLHRDFKVAADFDMTVLFKEGLRRGIRHAWRPAIRRIGRRLRVRPAAR
jgi:type VI secretion system protein ImpC